jgi:hypothetical protein
MKTRLTTMTMLALAAAPAVAADSLRCGSKIVRVGMTMSEVRQHCGGPSDSSTEVQDVRAGTRVVGKTEVHTWRYDRGSAQRTAVLEFDQEKLMSIRYESD